MTKLFLTGATGYIGGDALHAVAHTYPDLQITALARNSDKGAKIAAQYAKIRLVYGDLDNSELLTKEASQADIVLHCASSGHIGAANALIAGLAQRQTPSYLIHNGGAGILGFADLDRKSYGVKDEKVYNDWDGISEVTSLPDTAPHRNVDKVVLSASTSSSNVFSAIVCPPCIYGPGRGPDNKKSIQAYRLASATIVRGKGFTVEEGDNIWNQVHVQDLSNVYLSLVTAALEPDGGKATWNSEGYYFAEAGDIVWGDVARAIVKAAHDQKLIDTTELDRLSPSEVDKLTPAGGFLLGTNSRGTAVRAKKLFGWTPKQKSLFDLLPGIVEAEAKELGVIKGHAVKAAGDA